MNINDLPKGSYTAVPAPTGLNINSLPKTAVVPAPQTPVVAPITPKTNNLADSIWNVLASTVNATKTQASEGINQIQEAAKTIQSGAPGENPIVAGLTAGLKGESGLASVVSSPFAELFKPVSAAVNYTADKISDIPAVQKFANSKKGEITSDIAQPLADAGNIAGTILGVDQLAKVAPTLPAKASTVFDAAKEALTTPEPPPPGAASNITKPVVAPTETTPVPAKPGVVSQLLGIDGLGDQVKTSAQRIAADAPVTGPGAAKFPRPIDLYNTFINQEAKHLGDIKEDPAISLVGEKIGDAFQSVIKQKQVAGSTMADELEKTATKPVDTGPAFGEFQNELQKNGASYDSVDKQLSAGENSKFGDSDKSLLERYGQALQELGTNPTMKALDAFISRVPQDIKTLKAKNSITFSTNAERIIGNSLDDLRSSLTKSGTPEYTAARTKYSQLSQFIKNNAPLLGKITESGDFAKDASLAKSAVQSVLNNGKKDFLIKLEQLTGYKGLDEANLALQAMKDMGDSKGSSLLELMNEAKNSGTELPGTLGKIIGTGGKFAGKLIAGDKVAQTRAYLRSLKTPEK